MSKVIDDLSQVASGRRLSECGGKCVCCGAEVSEGSFRNAISLKEWGISGMCQKCQDSVFGED